MAIPCDNQRIFGWFALVNAAVVLSLTICTKGAFALLALPIGCLWPFIGLYFSKSLAIRAHAMTLIDPKNFANEEERDLYRLVESLRLRADLPEPLTVGIYESADVSAFATGPSKKEALIAFSSGLLARMSAAEIAAVAAHEVSHIANGDMLILTLVQAVINGVVLVVTLPLKFMVFLLHLSERSTWFERALVQFGHFVVASVLMFLGSLVVKYFSRQREFKADHLAAQLCERQHMIAALKALAGVPADIDVEPAQQAYAAFKISAPPGLMDIFSTHPSLQRRIAALESAE